MGDSKLEEDLLELLNPSTREDVRGMAAQHLLGLTGSKEGCQLIAQQIALLDCVLKLLSDQSPGIRKEATKIVINLTAEEGTAQTLLEPSLESTFTKVTSRLLKQCVDHENSDSALCDILTNLTRVADCARFVACVLMDSECMGLAQFVQNICDLYAQKSRQFTVVAMILMNLTQVPSVRRGLMEAPDRLLLRLMPVISVSACKSVVGIFQNCCFEYDFHEWLLSEEVDLLPRLLYPLAGPEELDDDDIDKLPLDLQFLPDTKERESDPEVRNMLIKSVHKLCSTKAGRAHVKEKNTYVILRELHKWEQNEENVECIMNVIDILIGDEPQAGMEDLHGVEIPPHLEEKFHQE